jgi:TMEM175 potassium channel family protein
VFVTMYGLTLLSIRLLGATLDLYAQHEHLYSPSAVGEDLRIDRRKRLPVIAAFLVVLLIGLALPGLAIGLYFGIVVYAIVPFGYVRRLLFGRKSPRSPS